MGFFSFFHTWQGLKLWKTELWISKNSGSRRTHGFTNIEAGKHKNSKKRVVYIFEYIIVLTYNYKMNPIINFSNDEYWERERGRQSPFILKMQKIMSMNWCLWKFIKFFIFIQIKASLRNIIILKKKKNWKLFSSII